MGRIASLAQRALFALEAEQAHKLSIAALKTGVPLTRAPFRSDRLRLRVAGLDFPNPLGLAAGYDKNAEVPDAALRLGFGFVECGTVTPRPQPGNDRPRIFRLQADRAVINRLGFNNEGHAAFLARIRQRQGTPGIVGINLGANKDSDDRIADYVAGIETFAGLASYLTVNISSPNTVGLRTLQGGEQLDRLLTRLVQARQVSGPGTPLFLKIAPDLSREQIGEIAAIVTRHGVDGLVISNTTLSRSGVSGLHSGEGGGLSGAPLFKRSTIVLARMRRLVGPDMAIIGVGGVDSAQTAIEKIRAGADLVQLYTGMIFAGPGLPGAILRGMDRHLRREGIDSITRLRGTGTEEWAERPLG